MIYLMIFFGFYNCMLHAQNDIIQEKFSSYDKKCSNTYISISENGQRYSPYILNQASDFFSVNILNTNIPDGCARIMLSAGDIWGDGTGYQMLLDSDATAYGTLIPTNRHLSSSGNVPASVYAKFEYKIPLNADGHLNTSNIVLNNAVFIDIPAGLYDYCITNPVPGEKMYIAGGEYSRGDNFKFEEGKIYSFTAIRDGAKDNILFEAWTLKKNDAAVIKINKPLKGDKFTSSETIDITVKNYGYNELNSIPVIIELDGNIIAKEVIEKSILSLEEYDYTFNAKLNLSEIKPYNIKVYTSLKGDENPNNDEISKTVTNLGNYIPMGKETAVVACDILFIDDGISDNYRAGIDILQEITFYPEIEGDRLKVDFTELIISKNIIYWPMYIPGDTLFIYEGPSANEESLLGAYSGNYSKRLPSFTSYSDDGALTFVFKKMSGLNATGWKANISCITPHEKDAGILSIITPIKAGSKSSEIKVELFNFGISPITSMNIGYSLNNNSPVTEVFSGYLAPAEKTEFTFDSKIDISEYGKYILNAYTQLPDDENKNNDTKTLSIEYKPNITLYGNNLASGIHGLVNFQSHDPENTLQSTCSYKDAKNHIISGEYLDGHLYFYTISNEYEPGNFIKLSLNECNVTNSYKIKDFVHEMTFDYSTGVMYGISARFENNQWVCNLNKINIDNGEMLFVTKLDNYLAGLACNLDGQLFGISDNGDFCKINKYNGNISTIKETNLFPETYFQSMAFDHYTGRLFISYVSEYTSGLYEIDPQNGDIYSLGKINNGLSQIVSLYTPFETLYVKKYMPKINDENVYIDSEIFLEFNNSFNVDYDKLSKIDITPSVGEINPHINENFINITHSGFDYKTEYTITIPKGAVKNYDKEIKWSFITKSDTNDSEKETKIMKVYPNPSTGLFNIEAFENSIVKIADISGKILETHNIRSGENLSIIRTPGLYFIYFENNNKTYVEKVIIY